MKPRAGCGQEETVRDAPGILFGREQDQTGHPGTKHCLARLWPEGFQGTLVLLSLFSWNPQHKIYFGSRVTTAQLHSREDPPEEEMATHSRILAQEIPLTAKLPGYSPGGPTASDTSEHTHPGWLKRPSKSKAASSAHWTAHVRSPKPRCFLSSSFLSESCRALWTGRGSAHRPPPTTSQASRSLPPHSNGQPWAQAQAGPTDSCRARAWTADRHWSRPLTRAVKHSRNRLWVPAAAHRNASHSPGHRPHPSFCPHQLRSSGVGPAREGVFSSPREADASPAVRD